MAGQNGIKVNDAKVCQFRGADGKMHSGIKIDGEKAQLNGEGKPILDKDGNVKTHKVSGIISDENAFDSSQKIGDDKMGMGLHCNNSLKNGETCRVADAADVAGQSAADALQKSDASEVCFLYVKRIHGEQFLLYKCATVAGKLIVVARSVMWMNTYAHDKSNRFSRNDLAI